MKHILITGSTDGIGKLAATKLAKKGHKVYLHGRNSDKLKNAVKEIKELARSENVSGFLADFSDLDAVKQMAHAVKSEVPQLDVLINNAGVFKSSKSQNKDGLEIRFVVNYFAPYLLTSTLIPLLQNGSESRIINLSSAAQSPVNLNVLNGAASVSEQEAYAQSKLALTMWSFYLAKQLQNINVIAVNPGSLLNTNMVMEAYGKFWSSADKGANILCDLSLSDEYKDATGYFDNDKGDPKGTFGKAHADAYEDGKIERLMEITASILDKQNLIST